MTNQELFLEVFKSSYIATNYDAKIVDNEVHLFYNEADSYLISVQMISRISSVFDFGMVVDIYNNKLRIRLI